MVLVPASWETGLWQSLGPFPRVPPSRSNLGSQGLIAKDLCRGLLPWRQKEESPGSRRRRVVLTPKGLGINFKGSPRSLRISSVQLLSRVWLSATPWTAALQASLSVTNLRSLLTLVSIESVMPSNHLIFCHPLLLLPLIFPSTGVFSSESVLHIWWSKYWRLSISPSREYSGLVSFRMAWLDLLAVQGTLKSLLQHHTSKASVLQGSAFFIV